MSDREQQRAARREVLDEAAGRLVEILAEYGEPAELNDTTRQQACYVLGWESDGLE